MNDFETRLSGALREIAEHAPPATTPQPTDSSLPSEASPWRRPILVAAVLFVIAGGAMGVTVLSQDTPPTQEDNVMVHQPAESGGARPSGADSAKPAPGSREAVDRVAARVTVHHNEPGYGKVAVDYDHAQVTVLWKGEAPDSIKALESQEPNGVTVLLRSSRYSEAELAAAANRTFDALAESIGTQKVSAVMPNARRTGVVVEIAKPWSGSSVADLEETAQVPVTVRLVDDAATPAEIPTASRQRSN